MRRASLFVILVGLAASHCARHDIGQTCPQLAEESGATASSETGSSDGTRTETQEVVGQSALFPCDELVCIATDGREGYCSKKCRDDAGCPEGFECRVIQDIGPFAGESYCAWKRCEARRDCGRVEDFCCAPVPGGVPGAEHKLCTFSDGGECS